MLFACSISGAVKAISPGALFEDPPARDRRRARTVGWPARGRHRPSWRADVRAGRGRTPPVSRRLVRRGRLLPCDRASSDPDALLAEAVRVLAVGGRFVLLVNHPMFQGREWLVDDQIVGERYWRVGPYLREDIVSEEVDPGVWLPFAHRPLSRYVNPVTALGCVLTRLKSPNRRWRSSRARSISSSSPPSHGCCCCASSGYAPSRWETRADGRVPDPRRHVGSRAFHRGGDVRGPWLVRHRQPASRPHRQGRRAHEPGRRGVRTGVPGVGARRLRGHRGARTGDKKAALDRSARACGLSGRPR